MRNPWEKNLGYSLLRPYVDWCTKASYSKVTVKGLKNIPEDGVVIYAPNHCNTLMDALVVLQSHKEATSFGCRADLFKNPKVDKILRFLKIFPIARKRDGMQAVAGNLQTFEEIIETMSHDIPFCLFAEGTHRAERSLLPIKKGIFKIAAQAYEELGRTIYVIPAGIEYDDYFTYMKPVTLTYGEPINVSEYLDTHKDLTDLDKLTSLTEILRERLSKLITYFPYDENFKTAVAEWEASRAPKKRWWEWPLGLIALPVFIACGILCCPMWLVSLILVGKLEDKAWANSMRMVTKLGLLPVLFILYAVLGFCLLPWYWAVVLLVALIFSHSVFFLILNLYKKLFNK